MTRCYITSISALPSSIHRCSKAATRIPLHPVSRSISTSLLRINCFETDASTISMHAYLIVAFFIIRA